MQHIALIYDFPQFDTGLFEGTAFSMSDGNAELVVKVAEHGDIVLSSKRIREGTGAVRGNNRLCTVRKLFGRDARNSLTRFAPPKS